MMTFKSSLVVLILVAVCYAHMGMPDGVQFYCGRTLARAIATICAEQGLMSKRSEGTMYNSIMLPFSKAEDEHMAWPWVSPSKAVGMSLPPKGKRQVVSECCDKPCSVDELASYCYY